MKLNMPGVMQFAAAFMIALSVAGVARAETFMLSSPAITGAPETGFHSGLTSQGRIDAKYAAKEKTTNRTSLPVSWEGVPKGTKVLALVMDDPDAQPVMQLMGKKGDAFIHWLAADINPAMGGLKANASAEEKGFVQGMNSAGTAGYTAPQPPASIPNDAKKPIIHVYRLKVYALSAPTGLKDGFTLDQLQAAMKGKILGEAQIDGSYSND